MLINTWLQLSTSAALQHVYYAQTEIDVPPAALWCRQAKLLTSYSQLHTNAECTQAPH
jgi:hypothetical protein